MNTCKHADEHDIRQHVVIKPNLERRYHVIGYFYPIDKGLTRFGPFITQRNKPSYFKDNFEPV